MGLFEAITFFQTQLSKILSQLEATLKVVRGYESVRLEYDGYRVVSLLVGNSRSPRING